MWVNSFKLDRALFRIAILLLLFIGGRSDTFSQILPFKNYTTKDGLISTNIHVLYQDSKGYLWIGTIDGISVYDGYSFKAYTMEDGLPSNRIWCIIESRFTPGLMWIGTSKGLCKYYRGIFTSFRLGNTEASNYVSSLMEDRSHILWCGSGSGIYQIKDNSVSSVALDELYSSPESIIEVNDSTILLSGGRGLFLYDQRKNVFRMIDIGFKHDSLNENWMQLVLENDSTIWAVSTDSVLRKVVNKHVVQQWKLNCKFTWVFFKGSEDNLWMGTTGGLYEVQNRTSSKPNIVNYTTANGLLWENVRAGFIDRENNIWLGLFGKCLTKFGTRNIYRFPYSRSQYQIMGEDRLAVDRNNHFWVLEEPNKLCEVWKDQSGTWHRFTHTVPGKRANKPMQGAIIDSRDRLWLMYHDCTLKCFETVSYNNRPSTMRLLKNFDPSNHFSHAWPLRILIDRNDFLWYSFIARGVAVFDFKKDSLLRVYCKSGAPPYDDVRYLCEDDSGNIWFGGVNWGVLKLEGGFYGLQNMILYNTTNGLPGNTVHFVGKDHRNGIWVGTRAAGAALIRNKVVKVLTMKDGLPSNSVVTIREDKQGYIWIGTFAGLAKVEVDNDYHIETIEELHSELIHSCKICPDGTIAVATEDALILIDLNKSIKHTYPPSIYITEFNVDGEHVEHDERELEFSHTQTYFMIDYTGVSLTFENDLLYQYKLEGIDADWQPPTKERKVILAALEPGDYTFKVKALTPHGIESVQPAVLHFTINPPFYQELWFIISVSVILIGSVYSYAKHRISKARKAHQRQQEFSHRLIESQEQERKRIAAELHDSVGQNLLIIKNRALLGLETCPSDQQATKELQTISSISSQTIDEVREISYNLRPYQLDRLGLTKAIHSLINRIKETFGINFTSDIALIDNLLPKDSEINLYRIIQEGLNNIAKHAHASNVKVNIEKSDAHISIVIEDDGKGFNVDTTLKSQEGFGIKGITERIRIIGGTFSINSSPDKGTKLSISIPYHGETDEK